MDPHAQVQAEFNELGNQSMMNEQMRQLNLGVHPIGLTTPDINIMSSSDPTTVVPVSTITEAPIAAAPMDAAIIPTGDITAATVVPPGDVPDPTGGDGCSWLDCDCCGGDCGGGDCGGGGSCCTIITMFGTSKGP
ncbi:hypothetical protein BGZ96_009904 [Linnemannia gamsii]|uniref:Hydrophobin n=1 Tax=Linnemannia gamsii TaxID=64522 RepID=A0ABQ7KE45_9FUNG|nr:hypothetical protein BGZ96_009904 [Linnemannia gamsii]